MPGTIKPGKTVALSRMQALIAGTLLHFPNGSFTLGNAPHTTPDLVARFQTVVDAILALLAAQAQVRDAVAHLRTVATDVAPLTKTYRRFLLAMFGDAAQPLADFGLQPEKPRTPLSSEQLATAAAKARATRVARGTKSRKQRLAIRGDVTAIVITPVTTTPDAPKS